MTELWTTRRKKISRRPRLTGVKKYVSTSLITCFSSRKIIRSDSLLWGAYRGPESPRWKKTRWWALCIHTRVYYSHARIHARMRDSRQVGPRTSKRSARPLKRRRVPRCRLIYGPPCPFFPFLSFLGAPSFRRPPYFRLRPSSLSLSLSLSPPFRTVYSVCVAHVSHGICCVVHGIPAAATATAADRLIRGPVPPLAFSSFGSLDILIFPSLLSSLPRAHTRAKTTIRPQASARVRLAACGTRVCVHGERVAYHGELSFANLRIDVTGTVQVRY